ncbi:MAG: SMP-30/gluconolactonase/LRE family protein, partial [Dehalococcoidia bacterium]
TLYGCQSTGRRLVRFNQDGSTSPMSHLIGGIYHNMPQDLVADRRGRLWFCDPHENLREAMNPQIHDKLDHASVLRLEAPDDEESPITRMTYDTDAPQALLLSQDEKTLFVAETSNDLQGTRELRAYPILEDDSLGLPILLHSFGADAKGAHRGVSGMTLDREGNVVACAGWSRGGPGPMVYVISPNGRILESHPLPEEPTNCAFGGFEKGTLYVTTRPGNLFRCSNTTRRGWSLYPSEN